MKKIPVTTPYFTEDEYKAVEAVLASGWVAQGPMVAKFEQAVADHEGVGNGVATTSCTSALHLAMVAGGLASGMDVIVPAFTFVATANAAVQTGAVPRLVDIDRNTYNIDADKVRTLIEQEYEVVDSVWRNKETGNMLWGIVPVHEFGLCCDIYAINQIARDYNLKVIEDAACALGARIGDIHEGGFGNPSCISFHPRKSITTGEGGMILTDDSAMAKRMRELRTHGSTVSAEARDKSHGFLLPEFHEAGFNYRMTDIQAAVGLAQMEKFEYILEEKRKKAGLYDDLIARLIPELITPKTPENYYHTYQSYVCMLDLDRLKIPDIETGGGFRNQLLQKLEDIGIATRQGTHAVHMLDYYKNRFHYKAEDCMNAYACDHLSITLPLYITMTDDDQVYVVQMIRKLLDERQ